MRKGRRETSRSIGESDRATMVEKAVAGRVKLWQGESVERAFAWINRKRFTCGSFGTLCCAAMRQFSREGPNATRWIVMFTLDYDIYNYNISTIVLAKTYFSSQCFFSLLNKIFYEAFLIWQNWDQFCCLRFITRDYFWKKKLFKNGRNMLKFRMSMFAWDITW